MKTKLVRNVNGYRVIYLPEHPKAMSSKNWCGWVYEHVVIAEKQLGRPLSDDEVVHHLDFNRSNNKVSNLLVILRGQHAKLHFWLDTGAPGWQQPGENRMNSGKSKSDPKTCRRCDVALQYKQKYYCSEDCRKFSDRKVEWPTAQQLDQDIASLSWEAIGRKYNVSSNAVRKWARIYDLI